MVFWFRVSGLQFREELKGLVTRTPVLLCGGHLIYIKVLGEFHKVFTMPGKATKTREIPSGQVTMGNAGACAHILFQKIVEGQCKPGVMYG